MIIGYYTQNIVTAVLIIGKLGKFRINKLTELKLSRLLKSQFIPHGLEKVALLCRIEMKPLRLADNLLELSDCPKTKILIHG